MFVTLSVVERQFALSYVDDNVRLSCSVVELLNKIKLVLQLLRDKIDTMNPERFSFLSQAIHSLPAVRYLLNATEDCLAYDWCH